MDEIMDKYKERFGECFPLMLVSGMSEGQIYEEIKECLKNDKPYEVDNDYDYQKLKYQIQI